MSQLRRRETLRELRNLYEAKRKQLNKDNSSDKNKHDNETHNDNENFSKEASNDGSNKEDLTDEGERLDPEMLRSGSHINKYRQAISLYDKNLSEKEKQKESLNIIGDQIAILNRKIKENPNSLRFEQSRQIWLKELKATIQNLDSELRSECEAIISKIYNTVEDEDDKVTFFFEKIEKIDTEIREIFKNSIDSSIFEAFKKKLLTLTRKIKDSARKAEESQRFKYEHVLNAADQTMKRLQDAFFNNKNNNVRRNRQTM